MHLCQKSCVFQTYGFTNSSLKGHTSYSIRKGFSGTSTTTTTSTSTSTLKFLDSGFNSVPSEVINFTSQHRQLLSSNIITLYSQRFKVSNIECLEAFSISPQRAQTVLPLQLFQWCP